MQTETIISLIIYMIAMLAIGYYSFKRTSDLSDYMLGGRGLGPMVTALSAGASDMSGWMMMGLPGAMYMSGLSSAWLSIGLCIGAYFNYRLLAPRFRVYTEIADDSITIPDYLENRFKDNTNLLRLVSGLVILVFFTLYVASGMVSGGTLFKSAFGLSYTTGVIITVVVVVSYTLFGGFLAVSMTDFVQGCIMFIALILVPVVAIFHIGGTGHAIQTIRHINPDLLNLFKGTTVIGVISLLSWGLGYFGQPHIIVRFMAIKTTRELRSARRIGISWMVISIIGSMAVGLTAISYYGHGYDTKVAQTVFIKFADTLFNPIISGFILAAVLAAIMSTISSQLLVTSSAVTEDFYKTFFHRKASDKELVAIGRFSVLVIALIAIWISYGASSILNIVGHAWAGFGSAFGPVILLSLYWKRMTRWGAFIGMILGGATVIFWLNMGHISPGFAWASKNIYEMIPGVILCTLGVILGTLFTREPKQEIKDVFDEMEVKLEEETGPKAKTA